METFQTSTNYYKILVLRLLEESIRKEMEKDYEGYINGIKALLRLLKIYMDEPTIKKIEKKFKDMEREIERIKKSNITDSQKKSKILEIKYEFFDTIATFVIDTLLASPIIEKEITGIIVHESKKDMLEEYAKLIRKPLSAFMVESGEYDEQ